MTTDNYYQAMKSSRKWRVGRIKNRYQISVVSCQISDVRKNVKKEQKTVKVTSVGM